MQDYCLAKTAQVDAQVLEDAARILRSQRCASSTISKCGWSSVSPVFAGMTLGEKAGQTYHEEIKFEASFAYGAQKNETFRSSGSVYSKF